MSIDPEDKMENVSKLIAVLLAITLLVILGGKI
jgi:hypothetical protein